MAKKKTARRKAGPPRGTAPSEEFKEGQSSLANRFNASRTEIAIGNYQDVVLRIASMSVKEDHDGRLYVMLNGIWTDKGNHEYTKEGETISYAGKLVSPRYNIGAESVTAGDIAMRNLGDNLEALGYGIPKFSGEAHFRSWLEETANSIQGKKAEVPCQVEMRRVEGYDRPFPGITVRQASPTSEGKPKRRRR